jgi:hypothetical protein
MKLVLVFFLTIIGIILISISIALVEIKNVIKKFLK